MQNKSLSEQQYQIELKILNRLIRRHQKMAIDLMCDQFNPEEYDKLSKEIDENEKRIRQNLIHTNK